jgi:Ca2+-binding RTX toxin-like protein
VVTIDTAAGNAKARHRGRDLGAGLGRHDACLGDLTDARLLGVADLDLSGSGGNRLIGNKGDNRIEAGDGDDVLTGGAGADILNGGGGRDTASYAEAAGGVFVRLWSGEGLSGEALGDVLTGIENLRGSGFADTLVGDGGANELWWRRRGRALGRGRRRRAERAVRVRMLAGAGRARHGQLRGGGGGVFVRLWSGEGLSGEALGDVLTGIENLRGSAFSRHAGGRQRRERAVRWAGADALWAGDGDDVLMGGAGCRSASGAGRARHGQLRGGGRRRVRAALVG